MKIKLSLILFLLLGFIKVDSSYSQNTWNKQDKMNSLLESKDLYQKKHFPSNYEILSLDIELFTNRLKSKFKREQHIIELPNADGSLSRFTCKETSNFETKLQAKFPNVKSYSAQGIDDSTAIAKISIGSDGFHAVIFSGNQETVYIDPYSRDDKDYIVYKRSSLSKADEDFKCEVETTAKKEFSISDFNKNANDGKLRTFRLALVCSAEYAQFHLGADQQNIPDTAADEVKKEAVLSAMNTSMTRINGILEKDLSIKLVLVNDNNKIIFLDAATDGITEGNANSMIAEVQTICDSNIGDLNYDIGHIFSTGGAGLAGLGVVCLTGQKARGVTGIGSPVGDPYDVDYVAHEMGHQFGATHTQNNNCNRAASTAVEPGSGSTIMGYAGICSPNVLSVGSATGNSDDYFHTVSIAQMWSTIETSANCASLTDTNNEAPVANAGLDYSIPKSTPFILKGSATDADGTRALTYNWEQIDNEVAIMPPLSDNAGGPMFRSLPSTISPNRYMPALATVLAGNTSSEWEVLPSIARDLNFSLLVRDNYNNGGGTSRDDMLVTVEDAEAFNVTSQNIPIIWDAGSSQTITWSKGTSDIAPINCQNVTIKLSEDGGLTFPIVLSANAVNDGSEVVIVPNNVTTQARIMIEAVDNIFYNINTVNFEIQSTVPSFVLSNTGGDLFACNSGDETVEYTLNLDFINGFTETVSFVATGQPDGSSVTFSPSTINEDGNVIMSVSNLDGTTAQDYTINIEGNSTSVNQNITVKLSITASDLETVTLVSPTAGATGISLSETLTWEAETNASYYVVEIANDIAFTNVISNGEPIENAYNATNLERDATYYWRVKAKNSCSEGVFSSIFSFTTENLEYCVSSFTQEADHITNVTFNTINNNSGNDEVDGYEDFTTLSTSIKRGEIHQVSVTFDTDGFQDNCIVFIDWNRDYVFDKATESYDLGLWYTSSGNGEIGTKNLDITVPNTAKFGDTRMRVIVEYSDGSSHGEGACDTDHASEYGETEDYTLIVEDVTASIVDIAFEGFNLYPNPTKGEFKLNLTLVNTDKVSVQLYDVRGRLIDEKNYYNTVVNFSESILFKEASSGLYLLKVINGALQTTRKLIIK